MINWCCKNAKGNKDKEKILKSDHQNDEDEDCDTSGFDLSDPDILKIWQKRFFDLFVDQKIFRRRRKFFCQRKFSIGPIFLNFLEPLINFGKWPFHFASSILIYFVRKLKKGYTNTVIRGHGAFDCVILPQKCFLLYHLFQ